MDSVYRSVLLPHQHVLRQSSQRGGTGGMWVDSARGEGVSTLDFCFARFIQSLLWQSTQQVDEDLQEAEPRPEGPVAGLAVQVADATASHHGAAPGGPQHQAEAQHALIGPLLQPGPVVGVLRHAAARGCKGVPDQAERHEEREDEGRRA